MSASTENKIIDDRFHYGETEHQHYLEKGYCLFDHFLTDAGLAECRRQIERMLAQLHSDIAPEWIIGSHQSERWVWDLATHPKLLDMIERQIGPNITFWSSHLLCKPPRTGLSVPWHQDAMEWNVKGSFSASIWIPLDDVDDQSGTMSILPGWHKKGPLPQIPRAGDARDDFDADIDPKALPENLDEMTVTYHLKAGQPAIHHVMMPHNSTPNRSDRWRRVMIFRYIAPDGELGEQTYYNYRTNEAFDRVFYLVRGEDVTGLGLPRSPFEKSA